MGQKITQTNQITPEVEVFLLRYFPYYQYKKLLNNGISVKTALVTNETDNEPLIVKIYFKPPFNEDEQTIYSNQLAYLSKLSQKIHHKKYFNIAPNLLIEDHFRAGIIIRQYFTHNLKERLYLMPYLTSIEKKWIAFQLLFAVRELHSASESHGDIKMENILLNDNLSVFLCDISSYKPAFIQTDDISSYTYYYGSNNSTKSCYLAPERLVDKGEFEEKKGDVYNKQPSMDIFSLGAVIAELFLEEALFDYTKLLNFKKGIYSIDDALSKIPNSKMVDLLQKMLLLDSAMRINSLQALTTFATEICPIAIPKFLLHFNVLITTTRYYKPDLQICFFYKHWHQLWKILFGVSVRAPPLKTKPKLTLINKLMLYPPSSRLEMNKAIQNDKNALIIRGFKCFLPKTSNTQLINEDKLTDEIFRMNDNEKILYIIINYLAQAILNMKYESSTLLAIEMLKHFSSKLADIEVLQIIIPYLVSLLKQTNNLSRLTALHVLLDLLYKIDYSTLVLPHSDYDYFDSYVFPSILALYESGISSLILEFTSVIDKAIDLEEKFLNITLRSKVQNLSAALAKQQTSSGFVHVESEKEKKSQRVNEIYASYDNQLSTFKKKLLQVIGEIVSKNEENDIQQTLIRQFPVLLKFYGLSHVNTFGFYVISYFNSKEWIIQKEVLNNLPKMIPTLGEEVFNSFILPCLEGMITNNTNELKTQELIASVNQLIRLEYLTLDNSQELFKRIIPFIVHPNLWVREQVINVVNARMAIIPKDQSLLLLNCLLEPYLICPNMLLDEAGLSSNIKPSISRIVFELKQLNIVFVLNEDNDLTAALKELMFIDSYGIKTNITIEENYIPLAKKPREQYIKSYFEEDYQKYIIKIEEKHKTEYELSFLSIILRNVTDLMNSNTCLMTAVQEIDFDNPDKSFLSQENFNSIFMCKAFNFIFKQDNIHQMITETDIGSQTQVKQFFDESSSVLQRYTAPNGTSTDRSRGKEVKRNYYGWRPQGKLITTIYTEKNIERLLPFSNNHFASFNSEGRVCLWKIYESNEEIQGKLALDFNVLPDYNSAYSNNVCSFNNCTSFLGASNNVIYKMDPYAQEPKAVEPLLTLKEDKSICLLKTYNELNNQVIFVTEDNVLNVYDNRMENIAQTCPLSKQKGLTSCISTLNSHLVFYLGTVNGFLLAYDYRINRISESFVYHENTPIVSIENYNPFGATIIEIDPDLMNSAKELAEYLVINGGSYDHEVGLWNINSRRCDVLFKVNSSKYEQGIYRSLTVDLPELVPEGKLVLSPYNKVLKDCFSALQQYTSRFPIQMRKSIWSNDVNRFFYDTSLKRLSKLSHIYQGTTTAQKALVLHGYPQTDSSIEFAPFVITAGNDLTIRFWDLTKEGLDKRSYLINAPNTLSSAYYSTLTFDNTLILQSNETHASPNVKASYISLSEYQNFNGNQFHIIPQNEYSDEANKLNFCTRISNASHRGIITDLLPIASNDRSHFLLSSSWDGSIKIWK